MIPVFYTSESALLVNSFSPSSNKPKLVADRWHQKFAKQLKFMAHPSATMDELAHCHSPAYIEGVLSCRIPNGFGTRQQGVPRSVMFTNGGMLNAARHILKEGLWAACAPYSGFHHAGMDFGGGFCTFNGLMVAAMNLLEEHRVEKVVILDCDYHYGNGTQDILDRLPTDDTAFVAHFTAGMQHTGPTDVADLMIGITEFLYKHRDADLVLYQAGADQHIKDPLGGLLTTREMKLRDALVFKTCYELDMPVVWNLAGGYQNPVEKVLLLHDQTMRECLKVYE